MGIGRKAKLLRLRKFAGDRVILKVAEMRSHQRVVIAVGADVERVDIFTGNSRTGAPYKGALRAGRKAGGVAGEKTFLPGRACGEPALRRNCERGLETVAQPGADAFFTEKGLCQREVDGKRQPDVKGRGHGIGQRFRKIYFPG